MSLGVVIKILRTTGLGLPLQNSEIVYLDIFIYINKKICKIVKLKNRKIQNSKNRELEKLKCQKNEWLKNLEKSGN